MKRFTLSAFFVVLVLTGFSQKHIRLSFSGSPSVNWMTTNNPVASNENSILGYNFGLNSDFYFSADERYSLLTGLQITNIGGEVSYHSAIDI